MRPTNRSVRVGKANKIEPAIVDDQNNTNKTIGPSDLLTVVIPSNSTESLEVSESRISKRTLASQLTYRDL
jgi:hypothetical protein